MRHRHLSRGKSRVTKYSLCRERDSNPHALSRQTLLRGSCLPFHHPGTFPHRIEHCGLGPAVEQDEPNLPRHGTLVGMSQNPLRVVIAEDEALIRLDLKEMLEEEGYSVVAEAGDGESAVGHVTTLRPDLAILDIKMPILDGISAAERIAAERIAPVVILTAFSQRELVERARDAGAMAYLVKPFTKADLVPAIEMAVSRFAEIRALDDEIGTLRERLEVRKLLDRAKGLLQTDHGLTEPEAFRWIQKTSMDRRLTMRKVAEAVIEGSMRVPAETPQP